MAKQTGGLGQMPLTLYLLVAGVVLWLYVRRASLGIDKHPGEGRSVPLRPSGGPPVLPPIFLPTPKPPPLQMPAESYQGGVFGK